MIQVLSATNMQTISATGSQEGRIIEAGGYGFGDAVFGYLGFGGY